MKNESQFNQSIKFLLDGLKNQTIKHGTVAGCAAGNIIAGFNGIELFKTANLVAWKGKTPAWYDVCHFNVIDYDNYVDDAKEQIDNSGYTPEEINKIEYAFENCKFDKNESIYMENGLMAVVDCLSDIHQVSLETSSQAKRKFELA